MTSPMCRAMQESQKKLVISKGRLLRSTWKFLQIALGVLQKTFM